ncbi:MAG TPA: dihydroorotate dehydrogenase [Acidimicrobiales bacterium]|nr:dihydroorotate dehydrogenase [Acidimicrobiales bacterium]
MSNLATRVGSLAFKNPILAASGTAGHGAELDAYFPLKGLGAVVVKSLSAEPWQGNPAPRVHETRVGMLNSVGLQNPGVEAWIEHELPDLQKTGATVVASIWGFTVEAYEKAAQMLRELDDKTVVAVEVNLSCPNVESRRDMFAHSPTLTAEAIEATTAANRPRWAKLSPNVTDLPEIAAAARQAGAEAVTLINTVMGMAIDVNGTRKPVLGNKGGGLSGAAIHPVAVRAVYDVHAALPDLPIVGVGGVSTGEEAVELMLAGASAVEVGTATFRDPKAPARVLKELERWCNKNGVTRVGDLRGMAHD